MKNAVVKGIKKFNQEDFTSLIKKFENENILPKSKTDLEENINFYMKNINQLKNKINGISELDYAYQILRLMILFKTTNKQELHKQLIRDINIIEIQIENEVVNLVQSKTGLDKNNILNNKRFKDWIMKLQQAKFSDNNLYRNKLSIFINELK